LKSCTRKRGGRGGKEGGKRGGRGGAVGEVNTFESIAKVNKVPSLHESSNLIYPPFSLSTGISPFGNLQ